MREKISEVIMNDSVKPARYSLLDAIRAVAVINMIAYHLCYNIFTVFGVWPDFYRCTPFVIWERLICCTFIVVSGMAMNFSRHGYRRGIVVSLCGCLVTAVTVLLMPSQAIWFGVLNFLGLAMLITFALRRELSRIPPLVGVIVFFLLFMLFYGLPKGFIGLFGYPLITLPEGLYQYRFLAFLGFEPKNFFSADYFPLLQWIFLYLAGFELWRLIERKGLDRFFRVRVPGLDFIGRHSLIIYMAHQPVLYGICWLVFTCLIRK